MLTTALWISLAAAGPLQVGAPGHHLGNPVRPMTAATERPPEACGRRLPLWVQGWPRVVPEAETTQSRPQESREPVLTQWQQGPTRVANPGKPIAFDALPSAFVPLDPAEWFAVTEPVSE